MSVSTAFGRIWQSTRKVEGLVVRLDRGSSNLPGRTERPANRRLSLSSVTGVSLRGRSYDSAVTTPRLLGTHCGCRCSLLVIAVDHDPEEDGTGTAPVHVRRDTDERGQLNLGIAHPHLLRGASRPAQARRSSLTMRRRAEQHDSLTPELSAAPGVPACVTPTGGLSCHASGLGRESLLR
jgi:hypothetical protein